MNLDCNEMLERIINSIIYSLKQLKNEHNTDWHLCFNDDLVRIVDCGFVTICYPHDTDGLQDHLSNINNYLKGYIDGLKVKR